MAAYFETLSPITTKWLVAPSSTAQGTNSGTPPPPANITHVPISPLVGDLLIVAGRGFSSVAGYPSLTPTDTGSGGWTAITSLLTSSDTLGVWTVQAWWKIATSADYNGGAGITLTLTGGATANPNSMVLECDGYRLTSGTPGGIDVSGGTIDAPNSSVSTYTLDASTGSSRPTDTDELVWAFLLVDTPPGGGPWSCTYKGVTPGSATAMSATAPTFSGAANTNMHGFHILGVTASATAATNEWVASWSSPRLPALIGATFYHS